MKSASTPRHTEESGFLVASTPFPSYLIDQVMPTLKDTEWRLLCIVVRQTLGWKEGEGRKRRDWLSQQQFKVRTGRASEAVSRAIDALVRRGLIEVTDVRGRILDSPPKRKGNQGPMYFTLGRLWISGGEASDRSSICEHRKANTTKKTLTK